MWREIGRAFGLALLTVLVCSVAYPLGIWGVARVAVRDEAEGSLLRNAAGEVVGSRLLGQAFTSPRYLWPRPSAVGYDAAASGGSNLSPASAELRSLVRVRIATLNLPEDVPADLVTASGSGLDPDVTLAGALAQAPRIAAARGLTVEQVEDLFRRQATPLPGGEGPLVRVLTANLALDAWR